MNKKFVILFFLVVLSSCSASGPKFSQVENVTDSVATVYIYRPWLSFNMAGWPNIYVDNKKEFSLKNGGYGVLYLKPGKHEIKAKGSMLLTNWYPSPVSFTSEYVAGKEYFVRVIPKLRDTMVTGSVVAMSGSAQISLIPKNEALKEISETNQVN